MSNRDISIAVALHIVLGAALASAQTTRTEVILQEKAAKATSVRPEKREKGDVIITKVERFFMPEPPAVRLTLGDFRAGAGFAAGVAYDAPVGRSLWTGKVAWSVKNFKQVLSVLELPPIAGDRFRVNSFIKWNDAPNLPYYGLGNTTPHGAEVSYGMRSVDAGIGVDVRADRRLRYGGSVAYLGVHSSEGTGDEPRIGRTFTNQDAPGLASTPTWLHATVYGAFDTRESPGYTRSGALYRLTLHRYTDPGGQFSFRQTEVDLRQFIPVLHKNWVVALQGRGVFTGSDRGQVVPYFMLPVVGGRDTLPAYEESRFADRNSLLLRSELRWAAAPVVDVAVFLDHGKVAPKIGGLNVQDLHRDWGVGVWIHSPTVTALRLEVAHGVEGWRFNIVHGFAFRG